MWASDELSYFLLVWNIIIILQLFSFASGKESRNICISVFADNRFLNQVVLEYGLLTF